MLIEMHVHFSGIKKIYLSSFLVVPAGQVNSSMAPLALSYTKYRHLSLYFSFEIYLQQDFDLQAQSKLSLLYSMVKLH